MIFGRRLLALALPFALFLSTASQASTTPKWDGTWAGTVENIGPVSVTIAKGKVVGYAIRGTAPYGIQYSTVTLDTVAFGDHDNYDVKIIKTGATTASGTAHSSLMGDGAASLSRQ
jgi:hypothetical protein